VDLDAARAGGWTLAPLVARIRAATALNIQSGGGMRSEADAMAMLDAGVSRVVVGSRAIDDPEAVAGWIARIGADRLVVALDARRDGDGTWWPASHGWTRAAARPLAPLLDHYRDAGLRHLLATDIDRDGMLSGPNLALYAAILARAPGLAVQASGGVRDVADITAACDAGCAGVVLGRALLDGRLSAADALAGASPC
jgi:phosphoribosylformimino-5-aminoimidazole carboxamide ribotide isomerase